jgi:hypothetical protein
MRQFVRREESAIRFRRSGLSKRNRDGRPAQDGPHHGGKKVTAGANPTFRAVIRGDRDVPAIYVSQAMNACAEAGITDISFSAVNKE